MGRDSNIRERENSIDKDEFEEELNFSADRDELFDIGNDNDDTVDMNDTHSNMTPLHKQKDDNRKTKDALGKLMKGFDDETNKLQERYHDPEIDKNFNDAALNMEKVDLEMLNEEEKLIERSRIKEQKQLLEEYEEDRMKLLNMERKEEDKMRYASSVMTNEILLEENRATIEVRENEARTFRSFAKKEEHLKHRIFKDEGEIIDMRKRLHFSKSKDRSHLFGGSRDKMYSLRWNQTPSPLEVKVLMARKVNEKLPKAHYALNVTVLDGFNGNEIFFKFSKDIMKDDYKDKLISMVRKHEHDDDEILEENEESKSSSHSASENGGVPKRRLQSPKLAENVPPSKLEFLKKTLKRLENQNMNYMDQSQAGDFDDVSLNSFLMPDVEHHRKMWAERNIDETNPLGDTTMKNKMISEFKQVLLNFQKNFSSLQKYEDPIKDEELEFCDKVYFMIPHDSIIEPSYLIMFELVLLDEKLSSTSDRVVAWGAYPLINRGKFKVPLILGKYDRNVDKFKDIEGKYMKNIDEWVCNLYFEMRDVKLVECVGHKEFMEFPVPSEIQAYLEGKIDEKKLNEIIDKKLNHVEGEGDSSEEEKDLENQEENSRSQNLEDGDLGRVVNGQFILNESQDKSLGSDSDGDNLSIYDVEGKDDQIPNLRQVDLREYKYAIEKKLLFSTDEDEEIKKIRYIFKELLLDIGIGRFGFRNTLASVMVMLVALWTRMYIHYLSQYIFLKLIDVPVTDTLIKWWTVDIEYGFWNVYQEVIAVASGPFGTTLFFSILILLTWLGHKYVEYFPKILAKYVVWFGFGSMGDPLLIAIVDTAARQNEGDFYKLPNFYEKAEDSPIAGYIVALVIYIFFVIVNIMIFYNYIIYLHLNGRLQDIYVRLLGDPRVFFIPDDNEMSLRHLLWCYYTAIVNSLRVVVNHMQIINDFGQECTVSTLQTSNYLTDVTLEVARTFIRDEQGCIKELAEKEISYLNVMESMSLTKMLSKVPTKKSMNFYNKIGNVGNKNLALIDKNAANPYNNQYNNDGYSDITSRKSKKNFGRRKSMVKRINTARSSKFKRSETNKSVNR